MAWRIEIINQPHVVDAVGDGIRVDISDLGISTVDSVQYLRLYELKGDLSEAEAKRIATELLADPVTQSYRCSVNGSVELEDGQWGVKVWFRSGVTDNTGETALKAVKDLGIKGIAAAATGRGYILGGHLSEQSVERICRRLLANDIIEEYSFYPG